MSETVGDYPLRRYRVDTDPAELAAVLGITVERFGIGRWGETES